MLVSGFWNLVPGADCRLTLETCNFYSDPGLARGPGEEGQGRDDFSPRGPEPSGVLSMLFSFSPELSHFLG